MKKIATKNKLLVAQRFFELVWNRIEDGDDTIYEELAPEGEYGDALCKEFNNDTILEVLRIGFREKYGETLKCGKLTSEIITEKKSELPKIEEVPEPLEVCPKCGGVVHFAHPAFDGGSLVYCPHCHYSPQVETWAPTDAQAAQRWNNFCEKEKQRKTK